ncbi:glycoside hydrolase family 43 protein [Paenibacillus sp. LHD-38]|uniref:glycoside hydrolase family 43 protein n=1 Tax=Paenibacillus sp. LHD-38 TaxID=3072143 RepID=UPI00280DCA7C|nr:glycoside hydrolase family 43 protein [Paenibacillus sp. LHD-38]MDQ8735645.1 glycoside hydrolase family 43 protein [Paenibacillus sp. LHD-38]
MLVKWKPFLLLAAALVVAAALIFILIRSFDSNPNSERNTGESSHEAAGSETPAVLKAYLKEDAVVLSSEKGIVYDFQLLIDEFPDDREVHRINATARIPTAFEVVSIVPNSTNLKATNVEFNSVNGRLELHIHNTDDSAISFANSDTSRELATIRLKLNRELTVVMNEEIKVNSMEIGYSDNKTDSYDVSGAVSKVSFAPLAGAIGKLPRNGNPVVSHKFGADPYALVFKDRVYLYNTNDVLEYDGDGNVKDNSYGNINKLSVISSDDLVNWTDHGEINAAGPEGAAKWATQSWAPAAAHKVINGQDKFFLYFANNASGIGVLSSDSPIGPWVDPIGKPLISRSMSAAADVTWLFDPAVLVDDDGKAYIYFGGGVPEGKDEMPNTARVMQLSEDMIGVVGEAASIPAPFMFEDAGINKYNGVYYYTYCSNFYNGARPEGSPPAGEIAYMTSDNPMGPWTYHGTILKNPGHFFGVGGNNHHVIFQFHDAWYIAYHAQTLSKAMGVPKGYRSTHLNKVLFSEDGSIGEIAADMKGVEQIKDFNPFVRVEAETIAWSAGINTQPLLTDDKEQTSVKLAVSDIGNGDWTAVSKVNFGSGATSFMAWVASAEDGGSIELRLDDPEGKLVGTLAVPSTEGWNQWVEVKTKVLGAEGIHDLYFVFNGKPGTELFKIGAWQFSK